MKKIKYFVIFFIFSIFACIFTACHKNKNKTLEIAFYNIPQEIQEEITKYIISQNENTTINYIVIEDTIPLSEQAKELKKDLKNVSMIFAQTDEDVKEFSESNKLVQKVSSQYLSGMPISVISTINRDGNNISRIPFIFDMCQIDINYGAYKNTSVKSLNLWNDLIQVATEEKSVFDTPVIFAYKNDEELLNTFGQLIEVFADYEAFETFYDSVYKAFKNYRANGSDALKEIDRLLKEDKGAQEAIFQLRRMMSKQNGVITSPVFSLNSNDTTFYADYNLCGIILSSLSAHRKINPDAIGSYRSIYYPPVSANAQRKFTAQEYCIIPLSNSEETLSLISKICNTDQTIISTATGLAPVQKSCATADHQADDVRFWITASSGPLPPLTNALPEAKALEYTAKALRNLLEE